MLEAAVKESIAAIEEDGADTIILGCSAAFWLQPLLQKRLLEIGWDVPVLEGARAAIEVAKMLVDLGVDASGLAFPGERPAKWRRKQDFLSGGRKHDRQAQASRRDGGASGGRQREGAAEISVGAGQAHRAARAGRRLGHPGAAAAAGAGEEARRAGDRRQPARRRGGDGRHHRDQGQARRLHAAPDRQLLLPEPGDPRFAALRHAERSSPPSPCWRRRR